MDEGVVYTFDGVAAVARGDVLALLYAADATMGRSGWLFGLVEQRVDRCPEGLAVLMLIPTFARPPDAATREFHQAGYERMRVRRLVTVPLGSVLHVSVVRLIMSAHLLTQRNRALHRIVSSVDDGVQRIREAATKLTPSEAQIRGDLDALHRASAREGDPPRRHDASLLHGAPG